MGCIRLHVHTAGTCAQVLVSIWSSGPKVGCWHPGTHSGVQEVDWVEGAWVESVLVRDLSLVHFSDKSRLFVRKVHIGHMTGDMW